MPAAAKPFIVVVMASNRRHYLPRLLLTRPRSNKTTSAP
jgi:hypothetical protein